MLRGRCAGTDWSGSWEGEVASAGLSMHLSQALAKKPQSPGAMNWTGILLLKFTGALERLALMPDVLLHHRRIQERSYNLLLGDWRLLRSSCLSLCLLAGPPSCLKGTHLKISVTSGILDQLREPFLAIVFPIFTSRKCVCQIAE